MPQTHYQCVAVAIHGRGIDPDALTEGQYPGLKPACCLGGHLIVEQVFRRKSEPTHPYRRCPMDRPPCRLLWCLHLNRRNERHPPAQRHSCRQDRILPGLYQLWFRNRFSKLPWRQIPELSRYDCGGHPTRKPEYRRRRRRRRPPHRGYLPARRTSFHRKQRFAMGSYRQPIRLPCLPGQPGWSSGTARHTARLSTFRSPSHGDDLMREGAAAHPVSGFQIEKARWPPGVHPVASSIS